MVFYKDAEAPFRVSRALQALAYVFDNGAKSVLLDQVEQLFFGSEIMIKTGQRHSCSAREIAHRGPFITFFAENARSMFQKCGQPSVKTAIAKVRAGMARLAPVYGRSGRSGFDGQ